MRRHAKASSAGSTDGTGSIRGLIRRAFATRGSSDGSKGSGAPSLRRRQSALIAGLALIVSLVFGASIAAATTPVVTIDPVSAEYTTAQLSGTIDVHGESGNRYGFQYSTDGVEWQPAPYFPVLKQAVPASGPQVVSFELTDLKPDTEYQARLFVLGVSTGDVPALSPDQPTFTTKPTTPPSAAIDPVTTVTGTTAHFTGTIDVNAPAGPLSPAAEAAYSVKWHFECTPECHGLAGGVVKPNESGAISDDAVRLEAHTSYEVKLVATSGAGNAGDGPVPFDTPFAQPGVQSAAGASDGKGGYILEGVVNPFNSHVSDCHFEYGPTTAYVYEAPCSPMPTGRNAVQELHMNADEGHFKLSLKGQTTTDLPFNATAAEVDAGLEALSTIGQGGVEVSLIAEEFTFTPIYVITFTGPLAETNVGDLQLIDDTTVGGGHNAINYLSVAVVGGNNLPILVEAHLTGLTPNATYHFRVVATNGVGTASSGDRVFVPTLAPAPPACPNDAVRAENNSMALPECRAYEMVSSPEKGGNAASLYLFNEGTSAIYNSRAGNIAGSGQGSLRESRYLTRRTGAGWETVPDLNGPGGTLFSPPYELPGSGIPTWLSEDLESSVWYTEPGGDGTANKIYIRNPDGGFTFVGNPPPGTSSILGAYFEYSLFDHSEDLSHLAFNGVTGYGISFGKGVYEFVGTGNDLPRRVDVDNAGSPLPGCDVELDQPGGTAHGNSMSTDGSVIYFTVHGGCPPGPVGDEIWARVDGTSSHEASQSRCTRTAGDAGGACNAPAAAHFQGASKDGSRVYFTTTQQLVNGDTDQTNDLYLYELATAANPSGALTEVSNEGKVEEVVRVSEDGSTAYFVSPAVLADNEDGLGEAAVPGDHNLYVWRRDGDHPAGQTKFVGRFAADDLKAETTSDGHYLVFTTASPMVPTDTDDGADVYRYDAESGETLRASTNIYGVGGNADGFDAEINTPVNTPEVTAEMFRHHSHVSITDDGDAIVFSTKEALSPAVDGNGASDVYLWRPGHVSLISTGAVGGDGKEAVIDGSGQDIYFTSAQQLAPSDPDDVGDVYDARVGGGFSFVETARCSGEACQPQLPAPPGTPAPASARSGDSGNVKAGSASVRALSSSARAKLAAGGKVGLKLRISAPGKLTVKGTAKIGGKQKQVFAAAVNAKKAGEVTVPVSLSKAALAQLRRTGSLTIQVSVAFAGGVAKASTLKLEAAKPRPGHSKRRGG